MFASEASVKNYFTDVVIFFVTIFEYNTPKDLAVGVIPHVGDAAVVKLLCFFEVFCNNISYEFIVWKVRKSA